MDFNTSGSLRSPFSPRVRQSITGRRPLGLSAAKKGQGKYIQAAEKPNGDVIYKTPLTTVETYGLPLPVMVTEALTFASGDVTVRLSPCGWCWLVTGRRVLTWPREALAPSVTASPSPAGPVAARELTLPQTDLAHKADLVMLFYEDNGQMPSCIGVSPEGIVRYWPSIAQEGVYVDISAELAGQECDKLIEYTREELVLATTTCTVVLLNPTVVEGRATVSCRTLRPPSGWLGGLGRRVSLLFFGSMPQHQDAKLVGVVALPPLDNEPGYVALVGGGAPLLQLWRGPELHAHSLRRALADAHARAHILPHGDLNSLEILALDVKAAGPTGLLLLLATVNVARSPEMRYALAHISIADPLSPCVTSLCGVRAARGSPRLIPSDPAMLYTQNSITVLASTAQSDKADYIDLSAEGDLILGAELCRGLPLLFSRKHGVLAVTCDAMRNTPSMCDSPMGSPCPSDMYDGNLSLYEIDPHEVSMVTTDACGKLKTAFLFHLRGDSVACRSIIEELFPTPTTGTGSPIHGSPSYGQGSPSYGQGSPSYGSVSPRNGPKQEIEERDVDSVLDRTVLKIATEMLDDIPAGDPRWRPQQSGSATHIALGSSAALAVAQQLRDKQRAFALFEAFLKATGLWGRLGLVSRETGGGVIPSTSALGLLAEQLTAAVTLQRLQHGPDQELIDDAIYQVVCSPHPTIEEDAQVSTALSTGALSPADVFYRRAGAATRALVALAKVAPPAEPKAAASYCARVVGVVTMVLGEILKCRTQWQTHTILPELGPKALLPALVELHKRALTQVSPLCTDASVRASLGGACASLADAALSMAAPLNGNSHTVHLYERMRTDVIRPFMEEGQIDRAAALAEKFKDFELLVEICVNNDDMDRLYGYIDKYSHEGMGEVSFAYLCDRSGARVARLVRTVGARWPRLLAWAHTPQRRPLKALLRLQLQQYGAAARTLKDMAVEETESVNRMTTMSSIAKLCLLASREPQPHIWDAISVRLSLSDQQAALPRALRLHYGLDAADTRVIPPVELVQMYIDSESNSLTEYDYKKALDLTDYVEDMELRDDLRLRVWCSCIRRDDWSACRVDCPEEELKGKMFFRLIDLVHVMGGDLEILLPPVEDIMTAPELAELVSDPRFHFIIKYGYECVDTTRNDPMET